MLCNARTTTFEYVNVRRESSWPQDEQWIIQPMGWAPFIHKIFCSTKGHATEGYCVSADCYSTLNKWIKSLIHRHYNVTALWQSGFLLKLYRRKLGQNQVFRNFLLNLKNCFGFAIICDLLSDVDNNQESKELNKIIIMYSTNNVKKNRILEFTSPDTRRQWCKNSDTIPLRNR